MKTVTVKFVVKNKKEADSLMNEISESIGNNSGFPYIESSIEKSKKKEIKEHKKLTE